MSFMITISQKELHRLEVIQKIRDERLSVVQAAELHSQRLSKRRPRTDFMNNPEVIAKHEKALAKMEAAE